jgi:hypothetical protein
VILKKQNAVSRWIQEGRRGEFFWIASLENCCSEIISFRTSGTVGFSGSDSIQGTLASPRQVAGLGFAFTNPNHS